MLTLMSFPALGHEPEGVVYPVFQWPEGREPVIDGNLYDEPLSLFNLDYEINLADWGPRKSYARDEMGQPPTEETQSDLYYKIIVSWSDCTNRLYIQELRLDDVWDYDGFVLRIDADHSGGYVVNPDTKALDELLYVIGLPDNDEPYSLGPYSAVSDHTWHIQSEYVEIAASYMNDTWETNLQGEWLYIESSWVLFDNIDLDNPDNSKIMDLEDNMIIGLSWIHHDDDGPDDDGYDTSRWFSSGNPDIFSQNADSDFILEPIDSGLWVNLDRSRDCAPPVLTQIAPESWGSLKQKMQRSFPKKEKE